MCEGLTSPAVMPPAAGLAAVPPPEDPLAGPAASSVAGPDHDGLLLVPTGELEQRLRELLAAGGDLLDFEVGAIVTELRERGEQDLLSSILGSPSRPARAEFDPASDSDAAALAGEVARSDAETEDFFSDNE